MGMKMYMEKEGVLVVWLDGYMYGGMRYGYDVAMHGHAKVGRNGVHGVV